MKYSREKITIAVVDAICDQTGIDRSDIEGTKRLEADFGLDSLDGVEIVMEIEDELGIEILDEMVENCKTVQDVIDAVFKNLRRSSMISHAYDFEVQTELTHGSVVVYLRTEPNGERVRYLSLPIDGVSHWGVAILVLKQLGVQWFSMPSKVLSKVPERHRLSDEIAELESRNPTFKAAIEDAEFSKALDAAAVSKLYDGMTERLACKRLEGRKGWEDAPEQVLRDLFYDAVARDSLIGAANYLAFMHQRGISLLPAPPQKVKLQVEVDTTKVQEQIAGLQAAISNLEGGNEPMKVTLEETAEKGVEVHDDPILKRLDHIAHTLDLTLRHMQEHP